MDHEGRLSKLAARVGSSDAAALLIGNLPNIRYLCGFTGSSGSLLVTPERSFFFSDGRYRTQAAQEVVGAEVGIYLNVDEYFSQLRKALDPVHGVGSSKVLYESLFTTVKRSEMSAYGSGLDDLEKAFEGRKLEGTEGWVEELRRIKEPEELDLIRTAARMADEGLAYILDRVEAGRSERELALDLEFHMRSMGADDVSFDPIVAAAERSALPHAHPTERQVEKGRYLLFDLGCIYKGYCSDLTRTVVVGPCDDRHREIYEMVLASEQAGLDAIKAGVSGIDADKAARDVMAAAGEADAFAHGLGHGVGIDIHEDPRLSSRSKHILQAGDVVTCEPGAYYEGWGGVRVEDLVIVTDNGNEVLSKAPKQLIVL